MTDTTFQRNECGRDTPINEGAALSVLGGTFAAHGTAFEGNRCIAFFAAGDARVGIEGSGFLANEMGAVLVGEAVIEVTNVQFEENFVNSAGGGAINCFGCDLQVDDSEFLANEAKDGGAIFGARAGTIQIRNSTFVKNLSRNGNGGALFVDKAEANTVVDASEFVENVSGDLGGAVYVAGPATIQNSLFARNGAKSSGGAIYGVISDRLTTITISNSTISQNLAVRNGGGTYFDIEQDTSSGRVENSTIVENVADSLNDFAGVGGGIYVDGRSIGEVSVKNSIVAKNLYTGVGVEFDLVLFEIIDVQHSLLGIDPGAQIANSVRGTFDNPLDPLLGPLADNGGLTATHALLPGSPAIDAGDPAFDGLQFDQRGDPFARVVNGRVDIGAFEFVGVQPTLVGGDANGDGGIGFGDFLILANNFGRTDASWEDGDFNNDDAVTFDDFLILSANFGAVLSFLAY